MKNKAEEAARKRHRRSIEEQISDLEEEKTRLLDRLKARELKTSPAHKASLGALRRIDKALNIAADEGETNLRHALAEARRALGEYLEKKGVRLPKARLPKGPRPKQ